MTKSANAFNRSRNNAGFGSCRHGSLSFPYRSSVYARGFLPARLLHEVVPNLGCGAVLAADRVAVDGGGGGDRRVAETFADGCDVHGFFEQEGGVDVA